MNSNKNQHWIPDSYLQAWCDPLKPDTHKPFVHVFNKDGTDRRPKNPSNIFCASELYTIRVGEQRDLRIERFFDRLEQGFISARKSLEANESLGEQHLEGLFAFTAAMMIRVPNKIEQFSKQWADIAKKVKSIRINPEAKSLPSIGSHSTHITLAEVERISEDPMGTWFPEAVSSHIEVLGELFRCEVLVNASPHPFLTSDSPAVISFPRRKESSIIARGLSWPGCKIIIPISPKFALRFCHGPANLYSVIQIGWAEVFEINCGIIWHSNKKIVSCESDPFFVETYLDFVRTAQKNRATS